MKEGHSKESAARIAQAKSGESLKTGKPPKDNIENDNQAVRDVIAQYEKTGRIAFYHPIKKRISVDGGRSMPEDEAMKKMKECIKRESQFKNGKTKAMREIMNKFPGIIK